MNTQTTRRDLLRGGTAALTAASWSRVLGANDRIRYGIIGAGDRGQHDMGLFMTNKSPPFAISTR